MFILLFLGTFSLKVSANNSTKNNEIIEEAYQSLNQKKYKRAILLFEKILSNISENHSEIFEAKIRENLAQAYWKNGQLEKAERQWRSAIAIYRQSKQNSSQKKLLSALLAFGQAYLSVGNYSLAIPVLIEAKSEAKRLVLEKETIVVTGSLAQAYLNLGNYLDSIKAYQEVLSLTEKPEYVVNTLNNLTIAFSRRALKNQLLANEVISEGNDLLSNALRQQAAKDFKTAAKIARRAVEESDTLENILAIRAWVNWQRLDKNASPEGRERVLTILRNLPPTRSKVFLTLDLAKLESSFKLLSVAEDLAESISDRLALSYVLLDQKKIFFQQGDWEKAIEISKKGIMAATATGAADSLYQHYWQAARIYKSTGNKLEAKKALASAIATLQDIRGSIALSSFRGQLDFRSEIEPIFRDYLELLLADEEVEVALDVFAQLRLFQLQSLFGDNCVDLVEPNFSPDNFLKKTNSGLITSIVLDNKTYVILQLPDKKIITKVQNINADSIIADVQNWRSALEFKYTYNYRAFSEKFYDLLIRPLEPELEDSQVENLVFISDRSLKSISPAVLYEREKQQYLIEKYGISLTLGLSYNPLKPIPEEPSTLALGLTKSYLGQSPLPNVAVEIEELKTLLNARTFLDREFTADNFEEAVEKYKLSIVHLATHADFGGTIDTSYILTSDRQVNLLELEAILDESKVPLNLLVLSACATAAGNDRSVLGLAGVGLRSGVQSTLGTLWYVQDEEIAELIIDFYRFLATPGTSTVQALRQAQLKQLKKSEQHPAFWSAFVIIQ
ncbi:MAG: CHAT domain-containing protein [Prochloraceae cyanobacterium]|nr:CHAT domain-containing protein [Prochloraceae cyanobacterium]